jgi:hypothetical protein
VVVGQLPAYFPFAAKAYWSVSSSFLLTGIPDQWQWIRVARHRPFARYLQEPPEHALAQLHHSWNCNSNYGWSWTDAGHNASCGVIEAAA